MAQTDHTAPSIVAWRRRVRRLSAVHNKAERAWDKILSEKPRRPWWRKREDCASAEYERTLNAIPMPPLDADGDP